mmetsp:Transcript_5991/g.8955  ORF Transcript_5991/g.8955 Transcript_5991/m.8955 type:complete len:80 (+) Transcript_5991:690-929(+)
MQQANTTQLNSIDTKRQQHMLASDVAQMLSSMLKAMKRKKICNPPGIPVRLNTKMEKMIGFTSWMSMSMFAFDKKYAET